MEDLKTLIKMLITDVQNLRNEIKEELNILKIEIRELKENNRCQDKKIDKKLIEKEMSRIGKKHIKQENLVIEAGSMDDYFRKDILPKIIEEEENYKKTLEKRKTIEEIQEEKDE